jgi:cysteine-rich repeat protein
VEKRWPDDADGEPHDEGEIIGEALYDLRKALQTKLGDGPGFEQFLKVYYGVMQRSADIPSTYPEALVADDDDGDLSNGTPNQCEINTTFALHGLTDPAVTIGLAPPVRDGNAISFTVHAPLASQCAPPTVMGATLTWAVQGGTQADIPLASAGDTWSAQIPDQADGTVVNYHVTVTMTDGSKVTYPQNPADPEYQMYVGTTKTIQCFDFETGLANWTHNATPAQRDEWQAGPPMGLGGDPQTAHGGANVLGIDLDNDGIYRDSTSQWVVSPDIDLQGYKSVHLQYWRWLNVEDGTYDQAQIFANDKSVWVNRGSAMNSATELNHTDKEWRFQDVDLTSAVAGGGPLKLKFQLDSDQGLELGGWTVDDVCIVAAKSASLCGNGEVDYGETCDDGNRTNGDGCSAECLLEGGGGGDNGGCCSSTRDPRGAIVLSVLTVGVVLRRRRRARR